MELYLLLYLHSNPNSHSVRIISLLKVEGKLSQLEDVQLTPWNEILMSFILHVSTTSLTVLLYRMRAMRNPTSTPCCACPTKSKDSTIICTHNYHQIEVRCWIQLFFHLFFSSTFFCLENYDCSRCLCVKHIFFNFHKSCSSYIWIPIALYNCFIPCSIFQNVWFIVYTFTVYKTLCILKISFCFPCCFTHSVLSKFCLAFLIYFLSILLWPDCKSTF